MSVYDTYRVVLTDPDGKQHAAAARDRDQAMAAFGDLVNDALPKGARVRVVSEKTWIESQAVSRG